MSKDKGFYVPENDGHIAAPKGKNHLLVVGIDKYQHITPLNNARSDAEAFRDLLLKKYCFAEEQLMELYDEDATRSNILRELESLAYKIEKEKDNLVIYFSGHGIYNKRMKRGAWMPVEAKKNETWDYIPYSRIREVLSAIQTHHTFLIADSCHAGHLFAEHNTRAGGSRMERDPSRWGLTAGRNEVVSDGKPGERSPFAQRLLNELEKAEKPLGVMRKP